VEPVTQGVFDAVMSDCRQGGYFISDIVFCLDAYGCPGGMSERQRLLHAKRLCLQWQGDIALALRHVDKRLEEIDAQESRKATDGPANKSLDKERGAFFGKVRREWSDSKVSGGLSVPVMATKVQHER
jgi:hypothetical protein